ncbi:hypothetical protein K432DRAFT_350167 [Lepidopterella palustris CBS 459.81]|uniref:tRNA/rRNA methyltransferase SpoU type domain-containing protein n=1 Tax=Lepidopterella palustris CBS 459.81 TaxID=1314670 RepID=A0A8E2ED93_9PEZI|nr:hypothetical protein K432DRAFT_350167 [Lepidopterella palustris CBS 459.81]
MFSGPAFRLWYRWVYQAGRYGPSQADFQDDNYWMLLQTGLLAGFSEQRKLCLAILTRSLYLLEINISTNHMSIMLKDRKIYESQYEKYCFLFGTIVLDRYPNQVSACCGDLSSMMSAESLIHQSWMTTLLSAAISPKVQDGIRKIIGCWYMEFVTQSKASPDAREFLMEGFLPWATQGFLFTSSILTSHHSTVCTHSSQLIGLVQAHVQNCSDNSTRLSLLRDILRFVLEKKGSIFPYALLSLVEGLLGGFKSTGSLGSILPFDIELIVQVSSQTGFAEIARDLCTAHCMAFTIKTSHEMCSSVQGFRILEERWNEIAGNSQSKQAVSMDQDTGPLRNDTARQRSLQAFSDQLRESNHRLLQGEGLIQACNYVLGVLEANDSTGISPQLLHHALDAIWDEFDTQEFPRTIVMKLPSLFLHTNCIRLCIGKEENTTNSQSVKDLLSLVAKFVRTMHRLSEGRPYALTPLTRSIRNVCLLLPDAIDSLGLEDFLVRFANNLPQPKPEFLLEAAFAGNLQDYLPQRTYASYYDQREWFGYACVIDLLNRFPEGQLKTAKRVLDRLLQAWVAQKVPVNIITKWKTILQLHMMVILSEFCILRNDSTEMSRYLKSFMDVLGMEPWPRYRYLLEWILARLYLHSPEHRDNILDLLEAQEDSTPKHTASLIKIAVTVASFVDTPHTFTLRLMTLLVTLCASSKVAIRHESHWAFPSVWDTAESRGWTDLLSNPAFAALNAHIRSLDKFQITSAEYSSRTLKLDQGNDHTLWNLFQGDYMRVDPPERELVTIADFEELWAEDPNLEAKLPPPRIPLGSPTTPISDPAPATNLETPNTTIINSTPTLPPSIPLQTKSSTWQTTLLPSGPSPGRATSLILIASLITNPHNLGGLSRAAEIFGASALYMPSLATLAHRDFLSVSVTSHKHIPIYALCPAELPEFLVDRKREGWSVVCVEQTDQSLVLGEGGTRLPRRCVLVLGSEKGGVPGEVLAESDGCVEIRQWGVTRSLNVQTAAAIALFEWQRVWGEGGREG